MLHCYHLDTQQLEKTFVYDYSPAVKSLNASDLATIFRSKTLSKRLFPDDRCLINWAPFRIMAENAQQIASKRAYILHSSISPDTVSTTLLTIADYFRCKVGLAYTLNIYGSDIRLLKDHLIGHIKRCIQVTKGIVHFEIHVHPSFPVDALDNCLQGLGIKRKSFNINRLYAVEMDRAMTMSKL